MGIVALAEPTNWFTSETPPPPPPASGGAPCAAPRPEPMTTAAANSTRCLRLIPHLDRAARPAPVQATCPIIDAMISRPSPCRVGAVAPAGADSEHEAQDLGDQVIALDGCPSIVRDRGNGTKADRFLTGHDSAAAGWRPSLHARRRRARGARRWGRRRWAWR